MISFYEINYTNYASKTSNAIVAPLFEACIVLSISILLLTNYTELV